jgi:hypothetical protein
MNVKNMKFENKCELKFESCEPFGEFECMMENGMKDELCCG